jgi:flagellar operon protein
VSVALNPALLPPGAAGAADAERARSGAQLPGGARIPGAARARPTGASADTAPAAGPSFAAALEQASNDASRAEPLRFSKHALQRVERRGIDVGPATLGRLADGVARAAGKGSRDSLVLVDGTAFVVSVPSRTVVTAVGAAHMRDHVFTNLDSAVIA